MRRQQARRVRHAAGSSEEDGRPGRRVAEPLAMLRERAELPSVLVPVAAVVVKVVDVELADGRVRLAQQVLALGAEGVAILRPGGCRAREAAALCELRPQASGQLSRRVQRN